MATPLTTNSTAVAATDHVSDDDGLAGGPL